MRAQASAASEPRVLIVDDDAAMVRSLEAILSFDFQIITAKSGIEATQLLALDQFEVVITDYNMPGLSGLQLLMQIREKWPDTIGILMTANANVSEVQRARADWRDFRVLVKPFDPAELTSMVKSASVFSQLRRATQRLERRRR